MIEQGEGPVAGNIIHRNSDEDVKQLMERFSVSEEDVQVAIQIMGGHRERIEKYLEDNRSPRLNNVW